MARTFGCHDLWLRPQKSGVGLGGRLCRDEQIFLVIWTVLCFYLLGSGVTWVLRELGIAWYLLALEVVKDVDDHLGKLATSPIFGEACSDRVRVWVRVLRQGWIRLRAYRHTGCRPIVGA